MVWFLVGGFELLVFKVGIVVIRLLPWLFWWFSLFGCCGLGLLVFGLVFGLLYLAGLVCWGWLSLRFGWV